MDGDLRSTLKAPVRYSGDAWQLEDGRHQWAVFAHAADGTCTELVGHIHDDGYEAAVEQLQDHLSFYPAPNGLNAASSDFVMTAQSAIAEALKQLHNACPDFEDAVSVSCRGEHTIGSSALARRMTAVRDELQAIYGAMPTVARAFIDRKFRG